jgi:hypothetical protein
MVKMNLKFDSALSLSRFENLVALNFGQAAAFQTIPTAGCRGGKAGESLTGQFIHAQGQPNTRGLAVSFYTSQDGGNGEKQGV